MLRGIFGPRRDVVTGEWSKLRKEGLKDLYSSHNIVRVTKSKKMRFMGCIARIGEMKVVYRVSVRIPEESNHLGDPGVDCRIILNGSEASMIWVYGLDRAG